MRAHLPHCSPIGFFGVGISSSSLMPQLSITENPSDILVAGKFNQVPLIMGCTSNEGLLAEMGKESFFGTGKAKEIGTFWSLELEKNSQKYLEIRNQLNDHYFKDGETDESIHKIIGDVGFFVGIVKAAKLAFEKSKNPIYFYVFSYEIALSNILLKSFGAANHNFKGVSHGGDGSFLFSNELTDKLDSLGPNIKKETLDAVRLVTKMWTDFARTGRPHELWEPINDVEQLKYFNIDKEPQLKVNPFAERLALWDKVLKDVGINAHIQENAES